MAPFATFLIANLDWRTAFIVMGLIAWLVIASLSLVLIKDPRDIGLLPNGVKSKAVPVSNQDKGTKTHPIGLSLRQAFSTSQFWYLGFVWLFLSVTVHLIFIHIVPYAVDLGISPMDAAVILSLIGSSAVLGRLGIGRASDTIGRTGPALACALLQGGALLCLIWLRDVWMFYAFAIAYGFLWGGFSTIITALIGDIFGMRSIGSIMGVIGIGWALGAAAGPAIGGVLFDVIGNYFMAFAVGAVSMLIATLLVTRIGRELDKKSYLDT